MEDKFPGAPASDETPAPAALEQPAPAPPSDALDEAGEPKPEAPAEVTVRAYVDANKLRRWQVALLRDRLGFEKSMPAADIAAALDTFSKEPI